MGDTSAHAHRSNRSLRQKYQWVSCFYDVLDYPWELQYRRWRPSILNDIRGDVVEVGVGTGNNLNHYHPSVHVKAVDISQNMLNMARRKSRNAACQIEYICDDACHLNHIETSSCDWLLSTFLCCVMPDELQPLAIAQFGRVLRPGGRFRILEIVYSRDPGLRRRQRRLAWLVEKIYGARFDRNTLAYLKTDAGLLISDVKFLKDDTYMLIEGVKIDAGQQAGRNLR